MRILYYLLQKEFRQIRRDPAIFRILFIMPMIQLLVMPLAADYEIKNIDLGIVDQDHSTVVRQLIGKIVASGYFRLTDVSPAFDRSMKAIESDRADLVLVIPPQWEKTLMKENKATVFMAVNAINGVKAGLGASYLQS